MRLPPVIAAFVLAIALSGCGSNEPQTSAAVEKAYREWDDAMIAGKHKLACPRMTTRFLAQSIKDAGYKSKSCESFVESTEEWAKKHPEVAEYRLADIQVRGDRATLIDSTPYEDKIDTARMTLVRRDGRWQVDQQAIVNSQSRQLRKPSTVES